MSDSPLRRGLTGLAALLGLASPACVDPQETSSARVAPAPTPASTAGPRRPAIDRERPVRVATATFAMG